LSAVY